MITSMLEVPLRLCVMGDPCWNSTSGVPTWVTHDTKPQRHSITEASQIVTPVSWFILFSVTSDYQPQKM